MPTNTLYDKDEATQPKPSAENEVDKSQNNPDDTGVENNSKSSEKSTETDKTLSAQDLRSKEATPDEGTSLYNDADQGGERFDGIKNRLGKLAQNKLLVGGIVGGGGSIFGLIIILILLAGSLKIPHLAQNITTYQFARLTRQYAQNAERTTAEKLALDAVPEVGANDARFAALREKYTSTTGKTKDTWAKLDKYRPAKAISNLETENNFKLNYSEPNIFGRSRLTGVTFNERTIINVKPGYSRFVPVLNSVLDFKNQVRLGREIGPEVQAALRANEYGPMVRSVTAKQIRQRLGISLIAFKLGGYEGKDAKQARLVSARERRSAIKDNATGETAKTGPIKDAVKDTVAAEEAAVASDTLLQETIDRGGVPSGVKAAIGNTLAKSGIETAIGVINPIYAVALPICIVYDGSLESSGPTIDNALRQQQSTYYYIASAADQQKNGSLPGDDSTKLALAVSALNDDLGDVSQANAVARAGAGTVNTSNTISAEASAGGNFTLLNATLGDGAVTSFINSVADKLCPILTDTKTAAVVGVGSLAVGFFTGGASEAAGQAAGRVATKAVEEVSKSLFERLATRTLTATARTKNFLFDVTKSTAKIVGATVVAKLIVASKAGQMNSGLAQGTDLANAADSGGNIAANEIQRQGFGGRPLSRGEVNQSDTTDSQYLAYLNQKNNSYTRYLAVSNSSSLFSKLAVSYGTVSIRSLNTKLANLTQSVLKPGQMFGSLLFSITGFAKAAPLDTTYGNIQFGWSQGEEALIDSSDSYKPLENQLVLDESGKEDEIASKYKHCFSDSLGTLLSSGSIVRDGHGNVTDEGGDSGCSPKNLGPNNPTYGQFVFRWRLAVSYNTTIEQLSGLQAEGSK